MSRELLEKFKKSWLEEIEKIQDRAIDSEGVHSIYSDFSSARSYLQVKLMLNNSSDEDFMEELDIIESKLVIALETARSRYRLKNRGLWARIAEGIGGIIWKIPKSPSTKTENECSNTESHS
jgi:hypothetical protein